jgi:hypothetical protein
VHVRRLRAKLGADNEALIGTVRNVGYRFVPAKPDGRADGPATPAGDGGPTEHAPGRGRPDGLAGSGGTAQQPGGTAQQEARPAHADR